MQRVQTKNYEIVKQIGEGSYSKVYKAIRLADNAIVAVKIVNITKMDKIMINSTLNEIRILHSVNNDHVVGYTEAFLDASENNLWIVMEYMGGGDLACAIKLAKKENRTFPERVIWVYLIQILRGLVSLNQFKIIHRDIKPANIFLTSDQKTVKLGDMNVSKVVENELTRTQIGTPSYLSPEIWEGKAYDARCDVYSLGCCMYEMGALKLPFEAKSMDELKQKIRNNIISPLPVPYSEELKKVIFKCLAKNPTMRPTAEKLLNSPIIELKITEYDLLVNQEDEKGKLLDTILFPSKISLLKNMLPKKQPSRRSSSVANLKSAEGKNDNFVSAQSKREIVSNANKSEAKISVPSNNNKSESDKKHLQPPSKLAGQSAQNIDALKVNMLKVNSRQEPQVEIVSNKKLVPNISDPQKYVSSKNNLPPPKDNKPKIGTNNEGLQAYEKLIALDLKKPVPGNSSQRDLPLKVDGSKGRTPSKNIPPSPLLKNELVKNQKQSSSKPVLVNAGSRNNSFSVKKLEPVIPDKKSSIQRQNSASKLSVGVVGTHLSSKRDINNGLIPNKLIPRASEKPLPPTSNAFKMPPQKSMGNQVRSSVNEIPRVSRYSTNPNSNGMRPSESRDKIIKFDDFIKNFEEANSRLSNLRDKNAGSANSIKGQRYSSAQQRTRV